MDSRDDDDFYEDDEPAAEVRRAFDEAEKHLTAPPRGLTETLYVSDLLTLELLTELPTSSAQVRA